ncbi:AarF/ABC1/UbiB kinase family protein [Bacillus sp. ISL-47]|uniref:ABC1 kinase family protein n=1 Tax=Bacillus sp. ISL-47 TaxID=2819130 RepID=UPI001BEAA3AC|nr:AarF/UbiB family protein [Bacillus sp. ISL-47]MBT2686646.1 AarF/ABC1/UbiB kinase family protein [Bacillus sp. ISL-47]MBT2707038.1 AarF/ABC1/UbiB kinase family protein [Pseudomonas sp. ISL-84]
MKTKNKLSRMYKVLSLAFRIFVQIYWYKWTRKPETQWEQLWSSIGKRVRHTLFELEGLLIKVGQFISIRSDLLPDAFIKEIQDLTDQVPASEWSKIHGILNNEWGSELSRKVLAIEKDAIASASIGEVYKGVLQDGSAVAIKVQRPEIQSIVQTDFRTLSILIWFADHFVPIPKGFINLKMLFQELKQVIERELDFTKEKETLLYFKERYKDRDIVRIPAVYPELCTSKVLVMEWVEGKRLMDQHAVEQLEISRQGLARRLLEVFLPQWLEPGMFHADPHPGNVLVSREGRIVLLDFGMAGEISKKDAAAFQSLIESFLAKNHSKAVECLSQLGFLLPEANTGTIEKLLAEWTAFDSAQLKEMDLVALKLELNDLIAALPVQVPTRFVFLGRSFITIEGIVRNLAPEEELLHSGKPVFMEWLNTQGNKWSFIWRVIQSQPLFKFFHTAAEFLDAPRKMEQLKEIEQRRAFQFTIYENRKKQLFQLMMLGAAGAGAGYYLTDGLILQLSLGVTVFAAAGYGVFSYKLGKWLKYMPEKRR